MAKLDWAPGAVSPEPLRQEVLREAAPPPAAALQEAGRQEVLSEARPERSPEVALREPLRQEGLPEAELEPLVARPAALRRSKPPCTEHIE